MTLTQFFNILYNLVCVVALFGSETEFLSIVPHQWHHQVAAVCGLAILIKSHWNLFINPNGSPAALPYPPAPPPAPAPPAQAPPAQDQK